MNRVSTFLFLFLALFTACEKDSSKDEVAPVIEVTPVIKTITVLDEEHLYFGAENDPNRQEGVEELNAGRILMKNVSFPDMGKAEKVVARLKLKSNGDPWDRIGSVFMASSPVSLFEISKRQDLAFTDRGKETGFTSDLEGQYQPVVELLRFATPFGVGYYNDQVAIKPGFGISQWKSEVVWERDVTELVSLMDGDIWFGIMIDTWTSKEGFTVSLELDVTEGNSTPSKKVVPLLNTVRYIGGQDYYDGFSAKDFEVPFTLVKDLKNVQLYYTVTGHGGYAEGDEFNKKQNIVKIDGNMALSYIPWRNDCDLFRAYNPSSAKWENDIWSSDLDRTNWCPGSLIKPTEGKVQNLKAGDHALSVRIVNATPSSEGKLNFWCVSVYLVGEE